MHVPNFDVDFRILQIEFRTTQKLYYLAEFYIGHITILNSFVIICRESIESQRKILLL